MKVAIKHKITAAWRDPELGEVTLYLQDLLFQETEGGP